MTWSRGSLLTAVLVAAALAAPARAQESGGLGRLFKRLNGRISLSAPWHLFAGLRAVDGVRLYMLGVTKKHRRGLAIFRLLLGTINAAADTAALDYVDAGWVLEDNANMNQICERLKGERLTRSRIYRRECGRV